MKYTRNFSSQISHLPWCCKIKTSEKTSMYVAHTVTRCGLIAPSGLDFIHSMRWGLQ